MNYKVMVMDKDENKRILKEISDNDLSKLTNDIEWLKMSMLSKDYYVMLRDNIKELSKNIQNISIRNKYLLDDMNRYLYNVLGSFYALIEYYEKNFNGMFGNIKKEYFDKYIEYRIMYALRLYTTHRGIAITSCRQSIRGVSLVVNLSELLKNYSKFNKNIKDDLKTMISKNEQIDIYLLVQGFEKMMSEMHRDLLKGIEKEVRTIMKNFEPYLVFENGNAIDTYILNEDDKVEIYLTNMLKFFCEKMCNPY